MTTLASFRAVNDPAKIRKLRKGARVVLPIEDGCVFVLSDQHYYSGLVSQSHKASIVLAKKLKPYALVSNGDAVDAACISRWPVGSFHELSNRPLVKNELEETTARLDEYESLSFVKFRTWNLGNHDARFETRLATVAPEYAGINGFTLKDHYPGWMPAWRTDFKVHPEAPPEVIVKHKFKGGMHAGQNNALWSGTSIVTGHDHMLKAYALTNSRGLIWGIHAGMMAPYDSPAFIHYTEDNVVNWQEGFVILHFRNGRFTGPELVHCTPDGRVLFRGEELDV